MTITTQGPEHKGDGSFHQCGSPDVVAVGQAENRLLSRDFVFATLADFANAFGMQMLVATLPVYVISLGGSSADAGLVSPSL